MTEPDPPADEARTMTAKERAQRERLRGLAARSLVRLNEKTGTASSAPVRARAARDD